ncbi:MAG: type I restriction enzyme endonuclease domain-containing protein, partial [Elusimicrobiota bacterium]
IAERIMHDKNKEEKAKIKQRYVREQDIAGAPKRIEKIVLDLVSHFENRVADPFKGMIVTVSRKEAIEYKKKMEEYNAPESAVIISGDHNDPEEMKKYTPSDEQERKLKKRFKDPNDDLKFVIVCEKLLTGFDVPVAQVMYLDKPLTGHNLLQAIARVNRPYTDKNYGLIVDYYGVSSDLQEALKQFSKQDVQRAMTKIDDQERVISKLEAAHRKTKSFFEDQSFDDLEECVEELENEKTRLEFNKAFKKFSRMMDIVLPEPEANPYKKDLKRAGEIYQMARNRYRDDSMDLAGCGKKVREIIREHIYSSDIEVVNPEPVSIMQEQEFEEELGELKSDKAKASEMQHAVMHEIDLKMDEDPTYFESLQEKVEELVERYNQKRIQEEKIIRELQGVIEDIRNRGGKAREKGFSGEAELSFYHLLDSVLDLEEEEIINLAKDLMEDIEDKTGVVDWKNKVSVQKEMRKKLKIELLGRAEINLNQEQIGSLVNDLIKLAREHF